MSYERPRVLRVPGSVRLWDGNRPPEADKPKMLRQRRLGALSAKVRAMARGFESKSVESQQEEAQRGKSMRPALSADEQARQSRKAGLELALAQTQAEMTAACKPAHREMLKLKLEAIQSQIRDL